MTTVAVRPILPILSVLLAACSPDSPQTAPGPVPGVVSAALVSPTGPEGAAIIDVVGRIASVTATTGRLFSSRRGDTTRVVIVRTDPGEIRFRFTLRDVAVPLSTRVVEVAAGDNSLRPNVATYSVKLTNDATP